MAGESVSNTGKRKGSTVNEPPKLDLECYIHNYSGRTRIQRLIHIGKYSAYLGVDALKLATKEAKETRDLKRYLKALNYLRHIAPNEPEAKNDQVWCEQSERENQAKSAHLEAQLKSYKNNLIKESVRMGNEDLGNHYQSIGELGKSYEAFSRMRQDISQAKQVIDISRHLIEVGIEQSNFNGIHSNIQKIRGIQGSAEDEKAIQPFISAAEGLVRLNGSEYKMAARAFLNTDAGMGTSCSTIISPNDIATYGGICALASMDRNEIQTRVLENSSFRAYLELEPHIRKAITFFVNSRYSACLSILESYRNDYLLDIHLQKHVDTLYSQIRAKSIVQYFIPFSCVTLDSLNDAFASSDPNSTIEKELAGMIERKELDGRIDTQNRLLTSVFQVPREALQNNALDTAKKYEREARLRIQHMNIVGAELEVKGAKKQQGGHGSIVGSFDADDGGYGGGPWNESARQLRSRPTPW
ncbi:COP9 signalosome-like protein complex subunit 1 [Calycina marina]|uniref:COP9 signalosome complex subunit 1 n=1 Tax=Calycina marina TaxID=1763456 RepID=A0A9P8CH16_9HELO|nr:COP9 signalosome-like protein complex subunit 1 [Calycina marina]